MVAVVVLDFFKLGDAVVFDVEDVLLAFDPGDGLIFPDSKHKTRQLNLALRLELISIVII